MPIFQLKNLNLNFHLTCNMKRMAFIKILYRKIGGKSIDGTGAVNATANNLRSQLEFTVHRRLIGGYACVLGLVHRFVTRVFCSFGRFQRLSTEWNAANNGASTVNHNKSENLIATGLTDAYQIERGERLKSFTQLNCVESKTNTRNYTKIGQCRARSCTLAPIPTW